MEEGIALCSSIVILRLVLFLQSTNPLICLLVPRTGARSRCAPPCAKGRLSAALSDL